MLKTNPGARPVNAHFKSTIMNKFIKQHGPKMRIKNALSLIDQQIKFRVEYTHGLGAYLDEIGIPYEFHQQDGVDQFITIHFPKQTTELLAINLWNLAMEFNEWKQKNNI